MFTARRTWLLVLFCFALCVTKEHQLLAAEIKDSARLEALMPNVSSFSRGRRVEISAAIRLVSLPEEPIEATALLTVNGQSHKPYYTIVTPGEIDAKVKYSWFIVPAGNSVTVRFRLIVIGNISKEGYEAADVTRDYRVKGSLHRPKCTCK